MKKILKLKVAFLEGESVILKSEPGIIRIVSGYIVRNNHITYGLGKGAEEESCRFESCPTLQRLKNEKNNRIVKGFVSGKAM
jgi:hypothetical protein